MRILLPIILLTGCACSELELMADALIDYRLLHTVRPTKKILRLNSRLSNTSRLLASVFTTVTQLQATKISTGTLRSLC
jgi:hypothetical protein